jgi:poly-beta-1,6-N-acetyl-D-glucosamine synthase
MASTIFLASIGAIAIIWFGYPAVVLAAASIRRAPRSEYPARPRVSCLLATRDDPDAIIRRVRDFLSADYPAELMEVIVAIDATAMIDAAPVEGFDRRVRVVPGDAPGGKSVTVNAAVRAATGDVLVFSDCAQSFTPDTIARLVGRLEGHRVGAVSGQLVLAGGARASTAAEYYWILERSLRKWEARLHSAVGVSGSVYAMRRELWTPMPAGLLLDDVYVPMQLVLKGWRVDFNDAAIATDSRRFGSADEYRRKVRTLTGVLQLCAWLPQILNPLKNPIWVQFVCHKLLRLLTPYLAVVAAISGAFVIARVADEHPAASRIVVAVALGAIVLMPPIRRRVVGLTQSAIALQAAVVTATWNASRGKWDVWK